MRRAVLAFAILAMLAGGCAVPVGGAIERCDPDLQPVGILAPEPGVQTADTIAIECYRIVRDSRLEVVFTMPPGPDCYGVSIVDAVESGDAISIELRAGELVNPLGGACPETESQWAVQVELNRSIGDRQVLDRSQPGS
jgi:hypothetical protein